jgi:membrane protein DedA with SNARE-associated domain
VLNPIDLLRLVVPLIAGMLLGYSLRGKRHINLNGVVFWTIVFLIFSLGFSIGSSNELLSSMPKVGFNALVILSLALLFSVFFVKAAGKLVRME